MTVKSFHTLMARLGERAGMPFSHPSHMLRNACGYSLANAGQQEDIAVQQVVGS
jgi:hypothetical protein